MTQEQAHEWVSVSEAVGRLGKTERTVRRWVSGGRLPWRQGATGLEVDVAGFRQADDRPEEAPPDLAGQVAALQAEVRHLQAMLDRVTGECDYLRQAHAAALTLQQALPERTVTAGPASPQPAPWWQFWRRSP